MLPDDELFFGFEDFDFFARVRAAGFAVLVDSPCARHVLGYQSSAGRDAALAAHRPVDAEEPWRAFYFARNYFALARRHGRPSWVAWHLVYSARRLQLASSAAERMAILHGLLQGACGRLGRHPRYQRAVGERPGPGAATAGHAAPVGAGADVAPAAAGPVPDVLAGGVTALVLSHNAPVALARCLAAIDAQSTPPHEIVVVDNASDPPVRAGERPHGSPPVRVVRSETNGGPAGGWAIAFEAFLAGEGRIAWALDDDIVPDPDCLERLLEAAATDPSSAFCFPWSVQPDGSAAPWGSWCGFVVARPIVEQVGLPRADLFWWAEDNEYVLWRIPRAGYERRIVDGALVQHDAVRQGGAVPTWKYYYEARNMLFLHLHLMRRVGWYPKNVTKLVARAVVRERGRRLRSLAAILRGLVDGALGRLGIRYPIEDMREQAAGRGASRREEAA